MVASDLDLVQTMKSLINVVLSSDRWKPADGPLAVTVPVNLELAPFIISGTTKHHPYVHPGRVLQGSQGEVTFGIYTPVRDPLTDLLEGVCLLAQTNEWPNVVFAPLDPLVFRVGVDHLTEHGVGVERVVVHPDVFRSIDLSDFKGITDARVVVSKSVPERTCVLFAPPSFVGGVVWVGGDVGYVVHNFWRGMYIIHDVSERSGH